MASKNFTLQRDRRTFMSLRLCLLAGNPVYVVSRDPQLKISSARRSYQTFADDDNKTVVQVRIETGWVTLLSGEILSTGGKHGYKWTV